MSYTLNVKAFFFNAKTDYLPYYKNFTCTLPKNAVTKDILKEIQSQNENFSYPDHPLIFKINQLVVEADTPLSRIVSRLGTHLQIDPVNTYRSNNGLIINDDDFMQCFELLAPFATEEDKQYYTSLYALHYASETSHFDREYIGDAILILADKMIQEGHKDKVSILDAITSVNSGLLDCEYENNLFDSQDHTNTIQSLKTMLHHNDEDAYPSLLEMIKIRFGGSTPPKVEETVREKTKATMIDALEEKHIAYYPGLHHNEKIIQIISNLDIVTVPIHRAHKLSGTTLLKTNQKLALTKAGTTLLEAYDAGAEVLIVEDEETYQMFSTHFTTIEKVMGRKMLDFEIISSKDFISQLRHKNI